MSTPPKRIVIELDQPNQTQRSKQTARPRRRWPKLLGLFAFAVLAVVVLIAGGGYLWWYHYQSTPTYSLAVIIDAAQRNDMTTFDRLVDDEKIIDSLSKQITDNVAASPLGLVAGTAIRSQIDSLAPKLVPKLKQDFQQELAAQIREFSSTPQPFIVLALTLPTMVKTTTNSNTALVAATVRGQPVELTMQQDGNVWKVVSLKNDTLLRRLTDEVIKDLPVTGQIDVAEPRKRPKKRNR